MALEGDRRHWQGRLLVFLAWLAFALWLAAGHVVWRDEARAYSIALSGANIFAMLRNLHGEGHPALWYLLLRSLHDAFPTPAVLPIAGAAIGVAAMALFAFRAPFRLPLIALVLFSLWGAFEYVSLARNYGIAVLVMFVIAALYGRVRQNLWLGLLLALLCNTNVPACVLAAGILLFRFVEMLMPRSSSSRRDWLVFGGNAALAALGAFICFRTVYPPWNEQAVSLNLVDPSVGHVLAGLLDTHSSFTSIGVRGWRPLDLVVLPACCLGLMRRPGPLAAALFGYVALKLFFFMVYPSYYRHEALFLAYLISLYWMAAEGAGGSWAIRRPLEWVRLAGTTLFLLIMSLQTARLAKPVMQRIEGVPYSRSADVAKLLRRPDLAGAVVLADPDGMLEALAYYTDNPLWFMRQRSYGKIMRATDSSRVVMTLDQVLDDAELLHRQTGRPVVYLSQAHLQDQQPERQQVMFHDYTVRTPQSVGRLRAAMREIAVLRPAATDEEYDVYVYPR